MVHYRLGFDQYGQHLIDVVLTFQAQVGQQLWMPVWIPGSYLIREFARHVGRVRAVVQSSPDQEIAVHKISKNQWQLELQSTTWVEVHYQVYAFDLSVRGAYVDQSRLYVNPACVCLAVAGQEQQPIQLSLDVGASFRGLPVACSLPPIEPFSLAADADLPADRVLQATDYATLIDHPFEVAELAQTQFEVSGIVHRVAISGRHQTDLLRLSSDLQKICQAQIELFGSAPFADYLFMVMATGNHYGGLEHQNCTSLITPRDDLPKAGESARPSTAYRRFLGLCSHEYFHAWLVKTIRPEGFASPNLHQEVYTPLLWVFEGFTSYYDDLMLYRSGVIDLDAYLELLAEQITRYQQNTGRFQQSLSESSFDAWIKYYRPDENSSNAGTSYYNKGALLALCLDLTLRQRGSSLDAVLVALYQRAQAGQTVSPQTLPEICQQLIGDPLTVFWADYVDGTVELPLDSLLRQVGVELHTEEKLWPFGMKLQDQPQGVLVQQVLRDSAAARAGVSAHDIIVAMDGIRATTSLVQQHAERLQQQPSHLAVEVACHVFRRDELNLHRIRPYRSVMGS
ncbi:MAG: PDZ domain-containing protein, partial [Pseudomonadota bacterium]|nr:PDZ domain-containing protein [Pseudomonadota bacterium]